MTDRDLRKKRIALQRREQILKAATEIFTRRGFAAATVPEIARLAGIAAGTIYLYYPNKRDLFIAVIKNLIITAPLLELIARIPEGDITKTFKDILKDRFDLMQSELMSRIPSLMGEVQRDPELKALWAEHFLQPFLSRLDGIYRMMAASGKFRSMESAVAVRAVGGLILGFLILKIMEGENSPLDSLPRDRVADDLLNFVLRGLLATTEEQGQKETQYE